MRAATGIQRQPTLMLLVCFAWSLAGCSAMTNSGSSNGNPTPTLPSITTQPAAQSVSAGQTASFSVVATGTPPVAYQWQKGGNSIAGANAAGYTTPATTTADSGSQNLP